MGEERRCADLVRRWRRCRHWPKRRDSIASRGCRSSERRDSTASRGCRSSARSTAWQLSRMLDRSSERTLREDRGGGRRQWTSSGSRRRRERPWPWRRRSENKSEEGEHCTDGQGALGGCARWIPLEYSAKQSEISAEKFYGKFCTKSTGLKMLSTNARDRDLSTTF